MNAHWVTDALWFALAFATAMGITLFVTPLTISVALKFKIQDTPDGRLKKHTLPTPYLGGLAVAAAFVVAFGLLSSRDDTTYSEGTGILASGFMVLLLGLYDDLLNLSPSVKFLGQVLAAVVLYKADIHIDIESLPEWANLALTVLWVTGVANAFNLLDIMDGLASGTALVVTLFLFVISVSVQDSQMVPFMAITLAGALAGYLRFNWNPARIFLGDTGSLFIGFMIGALTMLVSYSDYNGQVALAAPLILLAVPLFDTAFVAWHRARKGIPFFRGSPDHFPLRLRESGLSVKAVAWSVIGASTVLGAMAMLLVFGSGETPFWILIGFGAMILTAAYVFSHLPVPGEGRKHEPDDNAQHSETTEASS